MACSQWLGWLACVDSIGLALRFDFLRKNFSILLFIKIAYDIVFFFYHLCSENSRQWTHVDVSSAVLPYFLNIL